LSRGVYSLLIELEEEQVIKHRPNLSWHLSKGYYIYTGSALGRGSTSLEKRLERHLKVNKKVFWHIDRLLAGAGKVVKVVYAKTTAKMECEVNKKILSLLHAKPMEGFGSSDCRCRCVGHLLYLTNNQENLDELLRRAYCELGLNYEELGIGLEIK